MPTMTDWERLRVRVGTVIRAEANRDAREPALALWIDFGTDELQSSAKITELYEPDAMVGRQVVAVTGFESMRVGGFRSDCLVLGVETEYGVVLLTPDRQVEPGCEVA